MSWFGHDISAILTSDADSSIRDTACNIEVADRVTVERRSVLWLSAAAVASVLTGSAALRGQDPTPPPREPQTPATGAGDLDFGAFLGEIHPLAKRVVESKGHNEEAYLMTVAAAMSRLRDPGGDLRTAMRTFVEKHSEDGKRFPLAAVAMSLKPGGGFSHHDHRDYNGVIMGIEGEVRIRNYDILGDVPVPPEGQAFQLRETADCLILPGRISSLGRRRDNIHDLVAGPDGARVLDVFTFFEPGATSHYLDVEAKPRDAERRIYDAAWKPRRRRANR